MIHHLIRHLHIWNSAFFSVLAVILIVRFATGMAKKREYNITDKRISLFFLIALYGQFIFGILLFIFSGKGVPFGEGSGAQEIIEVKRFWAVEHFTLMIFALFIAHLGFVFSVKSKGSREKYRKGLIYSLISVLLVIASLCTFYLM